MRTSTRRHRRQGLAVTIEYGLIAAMLCAAIVAAAFALRSAVSIADPDGTPVPVATASAMGER
ncbi:MAG: hypothetical protein AB7O56_01985 [Bauldia sp.]